MVTRLADGAANFFIGRPLAPSGTANQSSGSPAAGTTNLTLGNRLAGDRGYDGYKEVRMYSRILSLDEGNANIEDLLS